MVAPKNTLRTTKISPKRRKPATPKADLEKPLIEEYPMRDPVEDDFMHIKDAEEEVCRLARRIFSGPLTNYYSRIT